MAQVLSGFVIATFSIAHEASNTPRMGTRGKHSTRVDPPPARCDLETKGSAGYQWALSIEPPRKAEHSRWTGFDTASSSSGPRPDDL